MSLHIRFDHFFFRKLLLYLELSGEGKKVHFWLVNLVGARNPIVRPSVVLLGANKWPRHLSTRAQDRHGGSTMGRCFS